MCSDRLCLEKGLLTSDSSPEDSDNFSFLGCADDNSSLSCHALLAASQAFFLGVDGILFLFIDAGFGAGRSRKGGVGVLGVGMSM